jgi:hypothetical protein
MLSIFALFIMELIAFRWGSAKLAALGLSHGYTIYCARSSFEAYLLFQIRTDTMSAADMRLMVLSQAPKLSDLARRRLD